MGKYGLLVVVALLGGCVIGGGPVVGYGLKRGFYGGLAGHAGIYMGHLAVEAGGNRDGGVLQGRVEVEANRLRLLDGPDAGEPSPGIRAGIGYGVGSGPRGLSALVGPDVGFVRERMNCEGTPSFVVGVEWRYMGGESIIALAPRYEKIADICLR